MSLPFSDGSQLETGTMGGEKANDIKLEQGLLRSAPDPALRATLWRGGGITQLRSLSPRAAELA